MGVWKMYEIVKNYKQAIPATRFIGIKYGDEDRTNGSFASKWERWFETGRFEKLESLIKDDFRQAYEDFDAYVGLMRYKEGEKFEYWIGMFLPEGTMVPEGFEYVDFPESNLGVSWLHGQETEIFGKENECAKKLSEKGYEIVSDKNGAWWFFERYGCPRFTNPDESRKVILDICYFVK